MLFYGEERRADGVDHWHPIAAGFVTSLNRPGGTLTGVTTLTEELAAKQLEVLHELKPMTTSVALLVNPAGPLACRPSALVGQNELIAYGLKLGISPEEVMYIKGYPPVVLGSLRCLRNSLQPLLSSFAPSQMPRISR